MKPYIYIIAFILSAIVSCSKDTVMVVLDTVEEKILTEPKLAYSLVRTINDEDLQTRPVKARYALLYTWASYCNYYDTSNDSLIRIAYDYYVRDGYGTDAQCMYSCRLLGTIQMNANDYTSSMLSFQRAYHYGKIVGDNYSLGQICMNLKQLCSLSYNSEELRYAKLASSYYEAAHAERNILDSKVSVAFAYLRLDSIDACLQIIDSVYNVVVQKSDTFLIKRCLATRAKAYASIGDYQHAERDFVALNQNYGHSFSVGDNCNMAIILAKKGEYDKMNHFLEQASKDADSPIDSIYYFETMHSVYETLGDRDKKIEYLEKAARLRERVQFERLKQSVMTVQRDFVQQELELEKSESEKRQILWGASLVIMIMLSLGVFLFMRRQNRLQRLEVDRTAQQVSEILRDLNHKKEELNKLRDSSTKQSHQINSLFTQHLDELNRLCVSYESGQNTMFAKNSIYKEVQSIVKSLSAESETFSEIETLVDELYNGVLTKIKIDFPKLKDIDYKYFCYAFAGFSSRAISLLLDESIDNIYQKRSRWKAKIEQLPEPNRKPYLKLLG